MSNDSDFHVTVCSLPDHDELVAEIYVHGHFVGLLSQELGPDRTVFEFGGPINLTAPLRVFEQALSEAKDRLRRLPKRAAGHE